MTKKVDLIQIIAERADVTQPKTREILQSTLDAIVDTIILEGRIELRGFGVFEVRTRNARQARNPHTNEQIFLPAKNIVVFTPGKEVELRVSAIPKEFPFKKKTYKKKEEQYVEKKDPI